MSTILKNIILNEFEISEWESNSSDTYSDKNIEIITKAIIKYIKENHTIIAKTNGSYSIPPTINPIVNESLKSNLFTNLKTLDSFKTIWKNNVYTGDSENGIIRMFQAINLWLTTPPYQVTLNVNTPISGLLTSIIPPNVPLSPILFPTMSNMGILCDNEIKNKPFSKNTKNSIEEVWSIVSKYIQMGLNQNIVTPIPTSGFVTSFPYIGITTVTISFS